MKRESDELYEEMTIRMEQLGYRDEPLVDEDVQVASDILGFFEWQEEAPIAKRIGNVLGMVDYLHGRPLPEVRWLAKKELKLLETLQRLAEWGEELEHREEPDGFAQAMAHSEERCTFEDTLFAVTAEFFELLEELDEGWPV
jgi:hypothetical protein